MSFVEGKRVKSIEGVPVSEKDQERLKRDSEIGITHVGNPHPYLSRLSSRHFPMYSSSWRHTQTNHEFSEVNA
jgi:hypothetical protein